MHDMRTGTYFVLVLLLSVANSFAQTRPTSGAPTAIVSVRGTIDDYERDSLIKRFESARAAGAQTVIVEIDTYGGLVSSALDISRFIKRQNDLHTIAFVHDKAISAGAMIAMACDEIVTQPASVIGDCAPIVFGQDLKLESLAPTERAKAESPVLAEFHDSAIRNHHDPLIAEAMVSIGHEIRFVQSESGEKRLVGADAFKLLTQGGWKPAPGVIDPINSDNKLLTLYSRDAVAIGLSNGEFASPQALADARGLRVLATFSPGAGEAFIEALGNPIARLVLIIVFIISLKISLSVPGHGAPEAVAIVSLALLLGVPLLTGYATWWEVLLIFAGLGLLAFEVFVFPGHFVSAILGVLMIVVGLVLTFVGTEPSHPGIMPVMNSTWVALERGFATVTVGMLCSLLLWVWLNRYLPKIPYLNRLVLVPAGGDPTMMGALGADIVWPLVGSTGKALSELKPGGTAEFLDSTTNSSRPVSVVSDGGFVLPGSEVVVVESRGNHVVVRPAGAS